MIDLKTGDIATGATQFNVLGLGEERHYTQKYQNSSEK